MKKKILLIICLGLLLAGCGETETAPLPTDTPIPPTDTPVPTATATPLPTPTPKPILPPLSTHIQENNLGDLAFLMGVENSEYNGGYYRWAIGLANVMIENWASDFTDIYLLRSESYIAIGDYEQGIAELETAFQLPNRADSETYAGLLNDLCWEIGIFGEAKQALPYCEEAVAFIQENNAIDVPVEMVLDSRGVVYGSLGMLEEAAADFQVVVDWLEENPVMLSPEMTALRQEWLVALENGENPFTPEVLEILRSDEIDPDAYPEPDMLDDYSRGHFVEILENDGFALIESGPNDVGVDTQVYMLMFDECVVGVILFGPEDEISEARMVLIGCSENQCLAEMRWFVKFLLFEDPLADMDSILMGEYFAWELITLQRLVDGEIDNTGEFALETLDLGVVREVDENGQIILIMSGW